MEVNLRNQKSKCWASNPINIDDIVISIYKSLAFVCIVSGIKETYYVLNAIKSSLLVWICHINNWDETHAFES